MIRATLQSIGHRTVSSIQSIGSRLKEAFSRTSIQAGPGWIAQQKKPLVLITTAGLAVGMVYLLNPVSLIEPGDIGLRTNRFTGSVEQLSDGPALIVPGVHVMRTYSTREHTFRNENAEEDRPFQSVEGLMLGVDLVLRYGIDGAGLRAQAHRLPTDIEHDWVRPALEATVHKVLSRHTVREIFSSKRSEIQQQIESELKAALAHDGVALKSLTLGKVTLPEDYKRGMESLLAEELASEKMRFTLELKSKQIKERELEAEGAKITREKQAQAAASEQLIAAKAQEEAMKHVIPFKERQIAQRQLEAEAEKQARIRGAEGAAQARRIEASGEADSRQKLADAEAYRQDKLGRISSEQMAREGALISRHPLLVQKAMVDKLSDKITVVIAPPGTDGKFLGAAIAGSGVNDSGLQTAQASAEEETAQPSPRR